MRLRKLSGVLYFCLLCVAPAYCQPGTLDSSFDAGSAIDNVVHVITRQSDGKILIGGEFKVAGKEAHMGLTRLNTDGSMDTTFRGEVYGFAYALAAQTDGKILAGGSFDLADGITKNNLARFNSDGSLDINFAPNLSGADRPVHALLQLPDGKILVGGEFARMSGRLSSCLARLNADGSVDTNYNSFAYNSSGNAAVYSLALQADGKIIVGGSFSSINTNQHSGIARLLADGSYDPDFAGGQANVFGYIYAICVQSDGNILVGGAFDSINGSAHKGIARLNANGTVDETFGAATAGVAGSVNAVQVDTTGRILVGGYFSQVNQTPRANLAVLNTDGSLASIVPITTSSTRVYALFSLETGFLAGGDIFLPSRRDYLIHMLPDGTIDESYGEVRTGPDGSVSSLALQPDQKIIMAGFFNTVNHVPRNGIARFNPDGSLDRTFAESTMGPSGAIRSMVIQSDGKILVGGGFQSIDGTLRYYLARLETDGRLDTNFVPTGNYIHGIWGVCKQDDKILVAGDNGVLRLNNDGTLDGTFVRTNFVSLVYDLTLQTDGKILLCGDFQQVGTYPRKGFARLNADGTVDTSFSNQSSGVYGTVYCIRQLSDGKVIIGGNFASIDNVPRYNLARLNSDGSVDTSFGHDYGGAASGVASLLIQPDAKILACGGFGVERFNSDGSFDSTYGSNDTSFSVGNFSVGGMCFQQDGRLIVGGSFTHVGLAGRRFIARLYGDRPPLNLALDQSSLKLSWPTGWVGFTPQAKVQIDAAWENLNLPLANDGTNWSATLTNEGPQRFFRLKR